MKKRYSDGMGTFLNVDKCCDDDNFVTLEIEEEQADDTYIDVNISLYKDEVKDLINHLNTLIEKNTEDESKLTEYIVKVNYYPIVVGKNELFKVRTTLSKDELHDKILKQLDNEYYEIYVLIETIEEYLKDIEILEI